VTRQVSGGCRRQVDGTAGLPSAPEMPCAPRQLRLVPLPDLTANQVVKAKKVVGYAASRLEQRLCFSQIGGIEALGERTRPTARAASWAR